MTGKTQISFYGGISTIGGNKILLTSGNKNSILLDFGRNFKIEKDYFNQYMKIRPNESLVDACMVDEIPLPVGNLKGIYMKDFFNENKYEPSAGDNRLIKIIDTKLGSYETDETADDVFKNFKADPKITEILVSHAHSDHVSDIKYINPEIKIVCSEDSKKILDIMENVSNSSLLTGIAQYKPLLISEKGKRKKPKPENRTFIKLEDGNEINCGKEDFTVKFFLTDHSTPGAGAFLITDNTTGKKIAYTGDIRDHGPQGERTKSFIEEAKEFSPDLLITEGTRIAKPDGSKKIRENDLGSEENVKNQIQNIIDEANSKKLILIQSAERDLWRFSSIVKALGEKRILVVDSKVYYFIQQMNPNNFDIDISKIKVYLPRKVWGVYDNQDYSYSPDIKSLLTVSEEESDKIRTKLKDAKIRDAQYHHLNLNQHFVIRPDEINKNPGKYIVHLSSLEMNQLFDIQPPPKSYFILSRSEPYDDEGEIEEQQRKNWLKLFDIPKSNQFQCHCSGHMQPDHLYSMMKEINPTKIFPVHTEHPELIKKTIGEKVVLPKFGRIYEI